MKILILLLFGTFIVTYGDVIDQSNNFLDELPFDEDALKELGIEYANLTFSWNQTPCPTSQACNDTQNPLFQSGKMFQSTDGEYDEISFQDPLPDQAYIHRIRVTIYGHFGCSSNSSTRFNLKINNIPLLMGLNLTNSSSSGCECDGTKCLDSVSFFTGDNSLFVGYNYLRKNTFKFKLLTNSAFISVIETRLDYQIIQLQKIVPSAGTILGGTEVLILANRFPRTFLKARSCVFGSISVEAKYLSTNNSTYMTCIAPAVTTAVVVEFSLQINGVKFSNDLVYSFVLDYNVSSVFYSIPGMTCNLTASNCTWNGDAFNRAIKLCPPFKDFYESRSNFSLLPDSEQTKLIRDSVSTNVRRRFSPNGIVGSESTTFDSDGEICQPTFIHAFTDPLPPGQLLYHVRVTFFGRFFCGERQAATFYSALNDDEITIDKLPEQPQSCSCKECVVDTTFQDTDDEDDPYPFQLSFPQYRYGQSNDFVTQVFTNDILLSAINISFFYRPIMISLESINPTSGPAAGGTAVFISGTNFPNTTVPLACVFNGVTTSAFLINGSMIQCTTPAVTDGGTISVGVSINNFVFYGSLQFEFDTFSFGWLDHYWWVLLVGLATIVLFSTALVLICNRRRKNKKSSGNSRRLTTNDYLTPLLTADKVSPHTSAGEFFNTEIAFADLSLSERIGRGNFGDVYKGSWQGTVVAVKIAKLPNNPDNMHQFIRDFQREAAIMMALRHPNVLQFLGICQTPSSELCIVTEYLPRTSLHKWIHDRTFKIDWRLRIRMLNDTACGMNYLHKSERKIIHRDLKSQNLLVDNDWKVKVCDFGLAKLLETTDETNTMTACGTPAFSAPEVLRNQPYSEKCDVYSFGILCWEILTREEPYSGLAPFQIVFAVASDGKRPTLPTNCPMEYADLTKECWSEYPEERPSFSDIIVKLEAIQKLIVDE